MKVTEESKSLKVLSQEPEEIDVFWLRLCQS